MAINVRCFARSALDYAAVNSKSLDTAGTLILPEPYLAREVLSVDTGAASATSEALAAAGSKLLQVQIDASAEVHLRVTKSGTTAVADSNDPLYSGDVLLAWGPGYSVSMLQKS